MTGIVRYLDPVRPASIPNPKHGDHPMRRVTDEMASGASFTTEHAGIVQALFDEIAPGWHTHDTPDRLVALVDVMERANLPAGVTVELGAGTGIGTKVISRFRYLDAAIDLSAGMLAEGPRGLAPWIRGDASQLPLADRSVDVLILMNMLLFPAEVERVLAASGALVWVNTVGEATPIHLSAEAVIDALPGHWEADASRAGDGIWCVARRST